MPPSTSACHTSAGRRNSFYARHHRSSSNTSTGSSCSQKSKTRTKSTSPFKQQCVLLAAKRTSTLPVPSAEASKRKMLRADEYAGEVISHMHEMEAKTTASIELMDVQPDLRWFMRPYLVDFLLEIHQTFRLRAETLFLTMNIVDRYVSKRIVYKRHYQLVGCAALLIAAKFEDSKDLVPTVNDLNLMCCNAYDKSAFTQMEGHVLSTIGWTLGHPTAEAWLRIEGVQGEQELSTINMARFFMEASLFQRDFIGVSSSALCRGALILARFINGQQSPSLQANNDATKAAHMLDTYMSENMEDLSLILIKKHSHHLYTNASSTVCEWYRLRSAASQAAPPTGLLPAQALRKSIDLSYEDEEDCDSMINTPLSTPSRSMDEDEDDEDMPVTPLSLYSLHDPLLAAVEKENQNLTSQPPTKNLLVPTLARTAFGSSTSWNVQ